ncbi:MAG: hypothetical protein QXJ14_04420, partial [Candidatus Aenigmatarchaeota archaeon]
MVANTRYADLRREFNYEGGRVIKLLKEIADYLISEDTKKCNPNYIISDTITRVDAHYQRLDKK